jgi:hypothetical protein
MEVSRRVDVTDRGGRGVPPLRASGDEAEGVRGLGLVRPGTHGLPPQDRNLMAQHEDLSILGCVTARQKRHSAEHPDHQQADQAKEHERRS